MTTKYVELVRSVKKLTFRDGNIMERNIEIAVHIWLCFVHINYNAVYKASNISIYGPA